MYRILLSLYGVDLASIEHDAPFTRSGIDADKLVGIHSRRPMLERIARTLGPGTTVNRRLIWLQRFVVGVSCPGGCRRRSGGLTRGPSVAPSG
jgi:hypothetical protein